MLGWIYENTRRKIHEYKNKILNIHPALLPGNGCSKTGNKIWCKSVRLYGYFVDSGVVYL